MEKLTNALLPAVIAIAAAGALLRGTNVFSSLTDGAAQGLKITVKILPPLVALLAAVYMFRASGALDALIRVCTPVFSFFGIPPETAPLIFIRPISGAGALAAATDIITSYGADSIIGRTAAVMLGSTETTFYTIAVYFGSANIKKTRYAVPAALCADITGFIAASLSVRLFWH